MSHPENGPEQDPPPSDEFESLEQLRQRVKDKQDAWLKLLEGLGHTPRTDNEPTEPQPPSA